jgi:hypothetical protein
MVRLGKNLGQGFVFAGASMARKRDLKFRMSGRQLLHHRQRRSGGLRQRGEDPEHWRRRILRRAGPHLRHPPRRHHQGRHRREAVGHRPRLVPKNLGVNVHKTISPLSAGQNKLACFIRLEVLL